MPPHFSKGMADLGEKQGFAEHPVQIGVSGSA